jgi:hypothetical protein
MMRAAGSRHQQERVMPTFPQLRRASYIVASFGAALAFAPAAAAAQHTIPAVVVEAASDPDLQRAAKLEAQAALEEASPRRWKDAATLYRRAAELHGETLEAAALYQRAAWLYTATGAHATARRQLERSARIALDRGDVVRAAGTLYDAALMAATDRDVRATETTLQRLEILLAAPLMPDDVRASMKQRMAEPARLARR